MARKAIILERADTGGVRYRVAFWLDVAAGREGYYADASASSVVPDVTADELTEIRAGRVVERVDYFSATPGLSTADLKVRLVTMWTSLQAALAADDTYDRYLTSWNGGTDWTGKGTG